MINRSVLVGRLTDKPNLSSTQTGKSVIAFTVAVNRNYKNAAGKVEADFIRCVAWNKIAENINTYCTKGSLVGIDGHIQTRHYDDKNGNRVYTTEVIVDGFSILESKKEQEERTNNAKYNNSNTNSNYNDTSNFNSGDTIDISDDDLPF
ncbi:MAG: hypothetical protein [Bacteriophage sp.]|nr:MAG: hypothetical protein [Bacteriophage sp.]